MKYLTVNLKLPENYSWLAGLWKATRGALLASLTLLLAAGGVDAFFDALRNGLGEAGLPIWMIPIVSGLIVFLRNFVKQLLAANKVVPPTEEVK